jgi:glycerol-3-phosphate dehydrogenase
MAEDGDFETVPGTQTLWLELRIAALHEAVVHLDDLLLRRTRLGILLARGGLDHEPRIRALCQKALGWGDARWQAEVARYRALIEAHYSLPAPSM